MSAVGAKAYRQKTAQLSPFGYEQFRNVNYQLLVSRIVRGNGNNWGAKQSYRDYSTGLWCLTEHCYSCHDNRDETPPAIQRFAARVSGSAGLASAKLETQIWQHANPKPNRRKSLHCLVAAEVPVSMRSATQQTGNHTVFVRFSQASARRDLSSRESNEAMKVPFIASHLIHRLRMYPHE